MKLYNAPMPAPNPRRVRIFLAEKGAEIPMVDLSIVKGEIKTPEHLSRDPLGQVPTLELDDGSFLSETVSICRYLEHLYPAPPLFGRSPLEAARIDMWTRRVELQLGTPVGMFWRHAHPLLKRIVVPQYTEFGESNRGHYERALTWLDGELSGKSFIAGADYTMADICALSLIDFAAGWVCHAPTTPPTLRPGMTASRNDLARRHDVAPRMA